jgi:hypothetical protein
MKDTQDFFPFEERILVESTSDLYPCDLCDQMNFPHVSWHCTHDDPAHVTTICSKCLKRLNDLPVFMGSEPKDKGKPVNWEFFDPFDPS